MHETEPSNDTSGEQLDKMVGATRDFMHDDPITNLNAKATGFVFHVDGPYEGVDDPDDDERTKRQTLQADVWGYVGSPS